jgi:CRP/FNR family transcriptional regulator, anaerobic regulatory protein
MIARQYNSPPLCTACPLRSTGLVCQSDIHTENGAMLERKMKRGQVLNCDTLANHFVMVRRGSLKIEFLNPDGRAEVAAFLLPGEPLVCVFSREEVAVTALEDTWLCDLDPLRLHGEAARSVLILQALYQSVAVQASSDQRRLLCARTGTVEDRLLWFLADIARRRRAATVELTMGRDDIAHYLEVSAESISRAFSRLNERNMIVRERPRRIRLVA